jgi:hypothetical protein
MNTYQWVCTAIHMPCHVPCTLQPYRFPKEHENVINISFPFLKLWPKPVQTAGHPLDVTRYQQKGWVTYGICNVFYKKHQDWLSTLQVVAWGKMRLVFDNHHQMRRDEAENLRYRGV